MDKLIISACICGAEVTKENNPAVPYTVEEVVREAKSAYDAGAALIHLHVRWDDGTPTQDKGRFQEMVDAIRKECPDVIIQPSTGGAVGMTDLERLQSTEITPTPEMATLELRYLQLWQETKSSSIQTTQSLTSATSCRKEVLSLNAKYSIRA